MNRNPLMLPVKQSDTKCNARTPRGYCKQRAGFRTAHFGEGRCHLHGGDTPINTNRKAELAFYTRYLPTTLSVEMQEIRNDSEFGTLFNEYALLKLIVQNLLRDLPLDIASIYGRLICSECAAKINSGDRKDAEVHFPINALENQKRLSKIVSTIESMSRVFEKITKAEERQKRFVTITEIEAVFLKWGKILMEHLGDHPKIAVIQQEIMNTGFLRRPGNQDDSRHNMIQEFLRKTTKHKENMNYAGKKDYTMYDALKYVEPELFKEDVEDVEIIDNWRSKKDIKRKVVKHDMAEYE